MTKEFSRAYPFVLAVCVLALSIAYHVAAWTLSPVPWTSMEDMAVRMIGLMWIVPVGAIATIWMGTYLFAGTVAMTSLIGAVMQLSFTAAVLPQGGSTVAAVVLTMTVMGIVALAIATLRSVYVNFLGERGIVPIQEPSS